MWWASIYAENGGELRFQGHAEMPWCEYEDQTKATKRFNILEEL